MPHYHNGSHKHLGQKMFSENWILWDESRSLEPSSLREGMLAMEEEGSVGAAGLPIQLQSVSYELQRHDGEPLQGTALKYCTPRTICMHEESPSEWVIHLRTEWERPGTVLC